MTKIESTDREISMRIEEIRNIASEEVLIALEELVILYEVKCIASEIEAINSSYLGIKEHMGW